VPLGVRDYWSAAASALQGQFQSGSVTATSQQVKGWLAGPGFSYTEWLRPLAWVAHAVKLFSLLVTCWLTVRWAARGFSQGTALAVVAMASICMHIPMLFIFKPDYRYAMLAWDQSLMVLAV
jgi:hypothetical protein